VATRHLHASAPPRHGQPQCGCGTPPVALRACTLAPGANAPHRLPLRPHGPCRRVSRGDGAEVLWGWPAEIRLHRGGAGRARRLVWHGPSPRLERASDHCGMGTTSSGRAPSSPRLLAVGVVTGIQPVRHVAVSQTHRQVFPIRMIGMGQEECPLCRGERFALANVNGLLRYL
jgi:hypothetical protein